MKVFVLRKLVSPAWYVHRRLQQGPSPTAFTAPIAHFDYYQKRHGEQRALREFAEGR